MISPIELTAEQRQDIYNQKAKRFMDGMQKLNEETGLHLIPIIQYTAQGNIIMFQLVEKTQPVDKPLVPLV